MKIELDREGLKILVQGTQPDYRVFENSLLKKAGHSYSDQYGRNSWSSLDNLSDNELYQLYLICRFINIKSKIV